MPLYCKAQWATIPQNSGKLPQPPPPEDSFCCANAQMVELRLGALQPCSMMRSQRVYARVPLTPLNEALMATLRPSLWFRRSHSDGPSLLLDKLRVRPCFHLVITPFTSISSSLSSSSAFSQLRTFTVCKNLCCAPTARTATRHGNLSALRAMSLLGYEPAAKPMRPPSQPLYRDIAFVGHLIVLQDF